MPSIVYYGSPRQARLEAKETLPAKLDLILERLHLRERVKDETVAIKMHTGNNIGYSTVHPVFVRKVVQAIKDGGGKPFVADVNWDVHGAEERGYSHETLGCPVYPAAGPDEKYFYRHHRPYKNIQDWKVAGLIQDATFLVNLAHAKGHPSCGFGAAFKNLALGCMAGRDARRHARHHALRPLLVRREVPGCGDAPADHGRLPARRIWWRTRRTPSCCTCTPRSATSAGAACRWRLPAA